MAKDTKQTIKLTLSGIVTCFVFLTNALLSQDGFSNTSGWVHYYNRESKVSLKHPPLWKCYSWSKNNIFIDMNGNVLSKYVDEYGRPVWTYVDVTIYNGSIKTLPLFPKFKRSDISAYDSYEYLVTGSRSSSLMIYLDIDGTKYIKFVIYNYLPENPGNIQTLKLIRTVIHSFSIELNKTGQII